MKLSSRLPIATVLALLLASFPGALRAGWITDYTWIMDKVEANRGDTVILPVRVESLSRIDGVTFAIIYHSEELEFITATPVPPTDSENNVFELHRIDRDPPLDRRGDVYGKLVFDSEDPAAFYPAREEHEILRFEFRVREDAEPGPTTIRFHDLYVNEDDPWSVDWNNTFLSGEDSFPAYCVEVRCQGQIIIDPPPPVPFLSGDVNADGQVSIADAVMLRRAIFIDEVDPSCGDAADVDDNGIVGITDAIRLMNHLILTPQDESLIAAPYPEIGLDPTPDDALYCSSYVPDPPAETQDLVRLEGLEAALSVSRSTRRSLSATCFLRTASSTR